MQAKSVSDLWFMFGVLSLVVLTLPLVYICFSKRGRVSWTTYEMGFQIDFAAYHHHHLILLLLLLRSQLYFWGSPFWVRFLRMWPFFNSAIEVAVHRILWAMLQRHSGSFVNPLPAVTDHRFTCLSPIWSSECLPSLSREPLLSVINGYSPRIETEQLFPVVWIVCFDHDWGVNCPSDSLSLSLSLSLSHTHTHTHTFAWRQLHWFSVCFQLFIQEVWLKKLQYHVLLTRRF